MGVNYCVNKPNLLGFLGIEGLAGEGHVQGVGDAGEGGQALSSSSSWENPKHDLRNPHTCLHTIHSNPVVTSHGNLQPSSQAGPQEPPYLSSYHPQQSCSDKPWQPPTLLPGRTP